MDVSSVERLFALPPDEFLKAAGLILDGTKNLKFIPSKGPQTDAYYSQADILLYGGTVGGGKTSLINGLAINEHNRSLIIRKQFSDLQGVIDCAKGLVGDDTDFVGGTRPKYYKQDGGIIHFEGLGVEEGIDPSKQGTPHDFIGIDEGAQLSENAVRMLLGWLRTTKDGQRCRMVIASNPPLDTVGDWMVHFFGPWLNENHENPAKPGDLRYFIINAEGESQEVPSMERVVIDGKTFYPHSRTFIPARLEDNPYINADDYRRKLQTMPEPYRSILESGNFMYARKDADWQVIPTEWVLAAQARWKPKPPEGVAMTAMALDPAGGGKDSAEIAMRWGGWYDNLVSAQGDETSDGSISAARIVQNRRDNCPVIVDVGGGYGGAVMLRLKDNGILCDKFDGRVTTGLGRTKDGQLEFANARAAAWWRFREELDPSQEGGSPVCLPPSQELRADLCAPQWSLGNRGILLESKDEIRKRLGRSPGKADAVIMALAPGERVAKRHGARFGIRPKIVLGYSNRR